MRRLTVWLITLFSLVMQTIIDASMLALYVIGINIVFNSTCLLFDYKCVLLETIWFVAITTNIFRGYKVFKKLLGKDE